MWNIFAVRYLVFVRLRFSENSIFLFAGALQPRKIGSFFRFANDDNDDDGTTAMMTTTIAAQRNDCEKNGRDYREEWLMQIIRSTHNITSYLFVCLQ